MKSRNYKMFYAIVKQYDLDKEEVVYEFTGGRTSSLRALTDGEFHELMIKLQKRQKPSKWSPKPGDNQRKKLIAIAGAMHWGQNTMEIIGKLNVWIESHWGKRMNDCSEDEINRILWVMENKIYKEYLKSI